VTSNEAGESSCRERGGCHTRTRHCCWLTLRFLLFCVQGEGGLTFCVHGHNARGVHHDATSSELCHTARAAQSGGAMLPRFAHRSRPPHDGPAYAWGQAHHRLCRYALLRRVVCADHPLSPVPHAGINSVHGGPASPLGFQGSAACLCERCPSTTLLRKLEHSVEVVPLCNCTGRCVGGKLGRDPRRASPGPVGPDR
jgi:hypothetical protein